MSQIAATSIGLRFLDRDAGPELVPAALTAALGAPPTRFAIKGEPMMRAGKIIGASSGAPVIARFNSWHYDVPRCEPGDLDGQIRELFAALTQDLSVWRPLAATYRPDLFVGLFMREFNEGMAVSSACLGILAERGVSLDLDIYAPTDDWRNYLARD